MKKLSTLALATTLGILSFGAHAAENFAGLTWAKPPSIPIVPAT